MKIALLGVATVPIMGGLEVHQHELARHLIKRGHEVTQWGVRSYRGQQLPEASTEGGVPTRRSAGVITFGRLEFYEAAYLHMAKQLARGGRPDIIHAHTVYPPGIAALLLRVLAGIPYVITSHGDEIMEFGRSASYAALKRASIRSIFRRASYSIAVSEELRRLALGLDSPSALTVRRSNVIDTERYTTELDREVCRSEWGIPHDRPVILALRRLSLKNGIQYLLRAFGRLPDRWRHASLVLCGDGELRGHLSELARDLRIEDRVRFLGTVPNQRVRELIYAADMAVFPSLAEATSIACLEAMACGTPVVVSDVGGLPEIVHDGQTGLVVPFELPASTFRDPGLPEAAIQRLTDAMVRLLDEPLLRKNLGRAAREVVLRDHSWDRYAEDIEAIYTSLLLHSRGRHA